MEEINSVNELAKQNEFTKQSRTSAEGTTNNNKIYR